MANIIQPSFSSGEISPSLYGRVDLARYQTSLKRCRNFITSPNGSVKNRPGTQYIASAKYADRKCRTVGFVFNVTQAYIWEVGHEYIRFFTDQAQITTQELDDPYTKLLLHNNGANNSTTFTDSSYVPHTVTANGNAKISTTQSKFGGSAAFFDGTGDYLAATDSADWDLAGGDFTIETWVYITDVTKNNTICSRVTNATTSYMYFTFEGSSLRFRDFHASANVVDFAETVSISNNTWYHVAVTRSGNNFRLFLGGVLQGTAHSDADPLTDRAVALDIGWLSAAAGTYEFNGYMDDFRWSKGTARYLATFLAPTVAFTNPSLQTIPYEIESPYQEEDLDGLRFESSADVTYVTHPSYQPQLLTRLDNDNWTLTDYSSDDGPFMPENVTTTTLAIDTVTVGTGRTLTASAPLFAALHVGALFKLSHYIEAQSVHNTFSSATNGTGIKCFLTWRLISHGTWTARFDIEKSTDGGSTWTTLRSFSSSNDNNVNTFGTEDVETNDIPFLLRVNVTSYSSGTLITDLSSDPFFQEGIARVTAVTTNILATVTVLKEVGDTATTDSWAEGSWSDYRGWPSEARFFQDRLGFANTPSEPMTTWLTRIGNYVSFFRHSPLLDDDGISVNLPTRQLNAINGLIALRKLVAFTSASEWSIGPISGNALTPTTTEQLPQGYRGSYGLNPVTVGNEAIYVQANSKVVRNLGYQFNVDGYVGSDINITSKHLFDRYTIVEMAYQQDPDSVIWMVRDDGVLLGLTYMIEQEVIGWHWHDTGGFDSVSGGSNPRDLFESVATIPGGRGYDELWCVVKRTNGRFIELMTQRMISEDCAGERIIKAQNQIFLDSSITLENTFEIENITVDGSGHVDVTLSEDHGLTDSTVVFVDCVDGTTQVNDLTFKMLNVSDTATVLLLHMNGANGGLTFTDSSSYARAVTPSGGAVTDTAEQVFGVSSALFGGGATNQLRISDSADFYFAALDFTIELRYKANDLGFTRALFSQWADNGSGGSVYLYHTIAGLEHRLHFAYSKTGIAGDYVDVEFNQDIVADVWYAIAIVRDGSTLRLFINGIQTATAAISGSLFNSIFQVNISSYEDGSSANQAVDGWIDEVIVTKGIAKYHGNYTLATSEFTISRQLRLTTIGGTPIDGTAYGDYLSGGHLSAALASFTGLDHLEGQTVGILADGIPLAQQVVTDGDVTITGSKFKLIIGLPYFSDFGTLKIDTPTKGGSMQASRVKVSNVTFRVEDTRGGYLGPDEENLYNAFETAIVDQIGSADLTELYTGDLRVGSGGEYKDGQIFYRQYDPLPVSILAVVPELDIGGPTR